VSVFFRDAADMHAKRRRMVGAMQKWLNKCGLKLNGEDVEIVQSTLCVMGPELIRDGECHDVGGARWVAREPMLEARMGCRGTNEVATVLRCEADRVGEADVVLLTPYSWRCDPFTMLVRCWVEMEQIGAKSFAWPILFVISLRQ